MAGERNKRVIDAMTSMERLQRNKQELSNELRAEARKNIIGTDTPATPSGVAYGAVQLLSRAITTGGSMVAGNPHVNYDATTASRVLAGVNANWTRNAQALAEALAYTNTKINELKKEQTDKETEARVKHVQEEERTQRHTDIRSGKITPTDAADHYIRILHMFNELKKPQQPEWLQQQADYLGGINAETKKAIQKYAWENSRWLNDTGVNR